VNVDNSREQIALERHSPPRLIIRNSQSRILRTGNATVRRVSVFGLGYVGLATALCLANKGHLVTGIDSDERRVRQLDQGIAPFFEPKIESYLKRAIDEEYFRVTNDSSSNAESDLAYVCVGTPTKHGGGIDLSFIESAAEDIGISLRKREAYQLIVIKSTVTPGTASNVVRPILERESGKTCPTGFGLCSNPEFLREGHAIQDTEVPDRIIIGSADMNAATKLERFYSEYYGAGLAPVIMTRHENAELIKYANNAFLATKVSFINTIANIAERIPGADVTTVAKAIGLDKRIAPEFLRAGIGFGGSCLPKDLSALMAFGEEVGYNTRLLAEVQAVNREQISKPITYLKHKLNTLKGKKIAILGLAFKPETDDLREAPSISIINDLVKEEAQVTVYDPRAEMIAKSIFGSQIAYATSARESLRAANGAVLVTEWEEFTHLTPQDFLELMEDPIVFDGRRLLEPGRMREAKLQFDAIGLGRESFPVAKY
jgi:UDPglucose 6-dehydrogenase